MADWGLYEYSLAAQVVMGLGVIVSLYLSARAVKEVQKDRRIGSRPYLMFEPGGGRVPVVFVQAGSGVPGVNPKVAEELFDHLPADAESVRPGKAKGDDNNGTRRPVLYGHLKNFGRGPALETHVTWRPDRIGVGSEWFPVDEDKQSEPSYRPNLNRMPTIPGHIESGARAKLSRIPTFIDKDYEKKISVVVGTVEITCRDIFGRNHTTYQDFRIFTEYDATDPFLVVTFGEMREPEDLSTPKTAPTAWALGSVRSLIGPPSNYSSTISYS